MTNAVLGWMSEMVNPNVRFDEGNVVSGKTYPLVVLFHGAGERGTNNVAQPKWGANELLGYMRENGIEGYFVAGQVPDGQQWVDTPWGNTSHRMNEKPSVSMALTFELLDSE